MKRNLTFLTSTMHFNLAFSFSGSGSGTSDGPYLVASGSLLNEIRNNLSASYMQKQDIIQSNLCKNLACSGIIAVIVTYTSDNINEFTRRIKSNKSIQNQFGCYFLKFRNQHNEKSMLR
jgi:hypothetical protein